MLLRMSNMYQTMVIILVLRASGAYIFEVQTDCYN